MRRRLRPPAAGNEALKLDVGDEGGGGGGGSAGVEGVNNFRIRVMVKEDKSSP